MQEQFNNIAPQIAKARPTVFPLPLEAVKNTVSVFGLKNYYFFNIQIFMHFLNKFFTLIVMGR